MEEAKNIVLVALTIIGTGIAKICGGWDGALQTLVFMMVTDWVLGVLIAIFWKKSNKSESGSLDSRAGFKGLLKKGVIIAVVAIATVLDSMVGTDAVVRTASILFYIGNEGISIIENIGIMGVPFPPAMKNAIEVLQKREQK